MRKKLSISLVCIVLTAAVAATPALADEETPDLVLGESASMTTDADSGEKVYPAVSMTDTLVYVDGEFACIADPIFDDGTNYVPFCAMSEALGAAEVEWNVEKGTASAKADGLEITVAAGDVYMIANGRYLYMEDGATVKDGTLMLPVRALCKAFGANVTWSPAERAVEITATGIPIASADDYYDEDSLYWLAHIINAESGNQPLDGKIAVGNVVMNRVHSPGFPNTVYKVVFDGCQFSPAVSGSVYCKPNAESWIAAKLVLDGADVAGESLYFAANRVAATCWAGRNRTVTMQIGGHTFFA